MRVTLMTLTWLAVMSTAVGWAAHTAHQEFSHQGLCTAQGENGVMTEQQQMCADGYAYAQHASRLEGPCRCCRQCSPPHTTYRSAACSLIWHSCKCIIPLVAPSLPICRLSDLPVAGVLDCPAARQVPPAHRSSAPPPAATPPLSSQHWRTSSARYASTHSGAVWLWSPVDTTFVQHASAITWATSCRADCSYHVRSGEKVWPARIQQFCRQ